MKKVFYFIKFGIAMLIMQFGSSALAQNGTFYGTVRPYPPKGLTLLVWIGGIFVSILGVAVLVDKIKKTRFKYERKYKKFKPNDKVKITFKCDDKIMKKHCRINALDDKKIVFETETESYECVPADIIRIQKHYWRNKVLVVLFAFVFSIVVVFGSLFLVYKYILNPKIEEDWTMVVEDYNP